jgi:anaerobic dimethyl sulfoxide reductase subunit C (anchor subunit)
MFRKEWSLIVNSLVIQLAAGLFTFLAAYRQIFSDQAGGEALVTQAICGMRLTGPLIVTGMILSLFHLGRPFRAYRAVTQIKTSWLSREVFFTAAFLALWAFSTWLDAGTTARMLWVWLTVLAGLLCVLSMSGIYAATGIPGWSGLHAYLHFFGTLIVFGSVSSTIILLLTRDTADAAQALSVLFTLLALLMLALRLIFQAKLILSLKSKSKEWSLDSLVAATPVPLPDALASLHQSLTLWGWVLSFSGVALALYAISAKAWDTGPWMLAAIGALVLAGESLQRMGFNSLGLADEMRGNP